MKAARSFVAYCLSILVIVITNFGVGLTILGFAWTILGCAPGVVHVASADSTAFQRMMDAEVTGNARRPAHLMKQYVRGGSSDKVGVLEDDKLPEAYTQADQRGVWPSNYHLGYAAERLIREFYGAAHPTQQVLENGELVEIVDEAGGNLYMLNEFDKDRHPDIVNIDRRFVFEVVPPGQAQRAVGKKRVDWNLLLINKAMIGVPTFTLGTGYAGEVGVRFAEGAPPWTLTWETVDPGVISYSWHVLSASDASEEAYGKAYLDNRWHDPTTYEMVRFARALHEVVERLVQAREALGQPRADTTMPILPGKTIADYLRSVTLWNAHDERIARLLPVMREPPPPPPRTRPDPRILAQTAGGGSSGSGSSPKMHPGATTPDGPVYQPHPSAPEAYTLDGKFGNMPWQFFLGYSAHRVIAWHYDALHPGIVYKNSISVATIVDKVGGDKMLLPWSEADLRPDITHITDNGDLFVFEIKPRGDVHLAKGKEKLAQYIGALNVGMAGTSKVFGPGPNYKGELWIRFKDGKRLWRITWETTAPGLLQYTWDRPDTLDDKEDLNALEQAWREAIENGRWRDISRAEMAADADALFRDVEEMVLRRDVLRLFRDAVTVAIEGVGATAEAVLTARLWDHIDTAPRLVPIVRVRPPLKQPTVSPKVPPRVNARPLGSDTRMTPPPRPAAPGKTPSGPSNISPN